MSLTNDMGLSEITMDKLVDLVNKTELALSRCVVSDAPSTVENNDKALKEASTLILHTERLLTGNLSYLYMKDFAIITNILNTVHKVMLKSDTVGAVRFFSTYKKLSDYGQYLIGLLTIKKEKTTYKILVQVDRNNNVTKPISAFNCNSVKDKTILSNILGKTSAIITHEIQKQLTKNVAVAMLEINVISRRNIVPKPSSSAPKIMFRKSADTKLKTNNNLSIFPLYEL